MFGYSNVYASLGLGYYSVPIIPQKYTVKDTLYLIIYLYISVYLSSYLSSSVEFDLLGVGAVREMYIQLNNPSSKPSLEGAWVAQSVKHLPLAQVTILESQDLALHGAPYSAGSLFLPLPPPALCLSNK